MAWVKAALQALAAATQSQLPEGGTPTKGRRTQHRLAVAKTMPRSKSRGAEWSFANTFQHACKKALATAAMNTAQVKVSTPKWLAFESHGPTLEGRRSRESGVHNRGLSVMDCGLAT